MNSGIRSVSPSGIRKFFDIANEMQDVISLSIGEPDFQTPWFLLYLLYHKTIEKSSV
jgi:aminotransferase